MGGGDAALSAFLEDLTRALTEPDDGAWDAWYAKHGTNGGVVFEAGFRIPSCLDGVRFGIFRREGLEAMRDFDAAWAASSP